MQVRNHLRLPRRSPIIAALATLASCGAYADEPSPWYIGATETIRHDSNVNRYTDDFVDPQGRGHGDTYSSTGLVGGFDQSYGRQHFYGTANVAYNKYRDYTELDNTSYGLTAGWDWATVNSFSGGVNASANQSLAQLNGNNGPTNSSSRNLLRTEQIGTNVNWGGLGALSVQTAYTHSRVGYSSTSTYASDSNADSASAGLYYKVGPTLTTGIAYRLTRTRNPGQEVLDSSGNITTVDSTSNGRNIDLSADWRYSVQTGVNARLSFTRQSNAGGSSQDFSGLTGSINATYAPTGKLSFNGSYSRDAGTNGSFFNVPITSGNTSTGPVYATSVYQNSTVANTFAVGANYAATAKIAVTANYSYRDARITNTGASDYDDKLQTGTLGVSWAVSRLWSLSCNVSHEKRDAQTVPVYAYTANVVGCTAQATLR